jgi:hypothetical protein
VCSSFRRLSKAWLSSLALGLFVCPTLPTLDDSEAGPGPPLARNPRTAHAAAWPCLSSRPTHPPSLHSLCLLSLLPAHASRLSPRTRSNQPGPRLGGSARLTARLTARPLTPLSPSTCLSVLLTPSRAPLLYLSPNPPRVACRTVFHPLSVTLALGPMSRLRPGYHSHPLALAQPHSKCVRICATLD